MPSILHVEFFDTDTSSYTHLLRLPLKRIHSFRVAENKVLEVEHEDGTTRFVPLLNVKQYHEPVPTGPTEARAIFVVLHDGAAQAHSVPEGIKVEIVNLDTIANNPAVEFLKISHEARGVIADGYAHVLEIAAECGMSRCENCERVWREDLLEPVQHLPQRVAPGEQMPSGQCPVCGAVCHPVTD
jgi:hypothetical protein